MEALDELTETWVEAHGYEFSQREEAPVTRDVSVPNPDTDVFSTINIATKGNTTYQKRLNFRCKNGTGLDSRNVTKTVTFTATTAGRLMYWGHEWSKRQWMITYINAARGSFNSQATGEQGLPRVADNEVHGFKPDLLYFELPIHNDGAAGPAAYPTADRWGRLTNNYTFRNDYELSLLTRASVFGYTPEVGMWNSTIAVNFGGIDDAGQLIFGDSGPAADRVSMSPLDKYDQAAWWAEQNQPDAVFVNATNRWVQAGFAIFGDLKTATEGGGKAGPNMTNEGSHPNDIGNAILAKVVCGPFCFEL